MRNIQAVKGFIVFSILKNTCVMCVASPPRRVVVYEKCWLKGNKIFTRQMFLMDIYGAAAKEAQKLKYSRVLVFYFER